MHQLLICVVLGSVLVAQTNQPTRQCTEQGKRTEASRLARLLREKGTDALVDEILRSGRELWAQVKESLSKPDGTIYFAEKMQSAKLPELSGTLLSTSGPDLLLNLSGTDMPEVILRLETPVPDPVQVGGTVLFAGVPIEFSPAPLSVLMVARGDEIRFLPQRASIGNAR